MAGSVVVTSQRISVDHIYKRKIVTLSWVGDAAGGTVPNTPISAATYGLTGMFFYSAETNPDVGPPTANYDIVVNDADGLDIAGGLLADRSNTLTQLVNIGLTAFGYPIVRGDLIVAISGTIVNSATGTLAKSGTLTNTKWCSSDGVVINCNEDAPAGAGDITAVGSCLTGSCAQIGNANTSGGYIDFLEDSDNGSNYIRLKSNDTLGGDYTVVLPNAAGTLALNDQAMFIGTTSVAINRTTAALTLAGITLTTPVLGAATGTSLIATGVVDGTAPIVITATSAGYTLGATYKSGYTFTNPVAAAATFNFTLPTPAVAGMQYCVGNGAAKTGILKVNAGTDNLIDLDGTLGSASGYAQATAVAGNFACFIGVDSTHWKAIPTKGTWTIAGP